MLLFRSFALGLLGACFLLLATRPPYEIRVIRAAPPSPLATGATIVDVAAGLRGDQLAEVLHLAAGEHVVAVDDRPCDIWGCRLVPDPGATVGRGEHAYLDLTVDGAHGPRRVLVLVH